MCVWSLLPWKNAVMSHSFSKCKQKVYMSNMTLSVPLTAKKWHIYPWLLSLYCWIWRNQIGVTGGDVDAWWYMHASWQILFFFAGGVGAHHGLFFIMVCAFEKQNFHLVKKPIQKFSPPPLLINTMSPVFSFTDYM